MTFVHPVYSAFGESMAGAGEAGPPLNFVEVLT